MVPFIVVLGWPRLVIVCLAAARQWGPETCRALASPTDAEFRGRSGNRLSFGLRAVFQLFHQERSSIETVQEEQVRGANRLRILGTSCLSCRRTDIQDNS